MSEHDRNKLVSWCIGAVLVELGCYLLGGFGGVCLVTGLWFMVPSRYLRMD